MLASPEQTTVLVKYDVDEAALALVRETCAVMTADTPAGYEEVRVAIGHLRDTRVSVEKRRVELKADALAYGRLVDCEAKRVTLLVTEIEDPLKAKKAAIDDAAARIKAEEDAAKLRIIEAEIQANRDKQEAEARAIRDAEDARLAAERAALAVEREALAAERAKADAQRQAEQARVAAEQAKVAEDQRIEREALDASRREIEQARQAAERVEFERQAKARAEKDAAEKIERERIETLRRKAELAALLPEVEKVRAFVAAIRALICPTVKSRKLYAALVAAMELLERAANALATAASDAKGGA